MSDWDNRKGFALLVVLFILLIIVGTAYNRRGYGGGFGGCGLGGFGGGYGGGIW
ncbi:YjcZ family sporulation protein [Alkalihalobacillus sp. AL-G]|uniref:YjcZ family sporulation protein n=1 Tax=Alkalihalobacillus sp. AL-G TaxID=2926399 RepID=UPI00272D0115|nr:YjcZ family sporulation protein [Alkalihalobacillus sp. AL-G]WLD92788.1 YjcZ family sporulation protein [Alkalihalobacillus sp. AL-G]